LEQNQDKVFEHKEEMAAIVSAIRDLYERAKRSLQRGKVKSEKSQKEKT